MATRTEIISDLHDRLTLLAELQGEDCPSFDDLDGQVRDWELKSLAEWLPAAPAPDSSEYAAMRDAFIVQAVDDELRPIVLPPRHAKQTVERTNRDWVAAFDKVGARLAEREDSMLALLGPRGTGKTQMAVELVRYMARHRIESKTIPAGKLERWAWAGHYYRSPAAKGFALYSTTADFFLRLRNTFRPDSEEHEADVLAEYINPSLLILDEAHERGGSAWENQRLNHVIDGRYQSACKQTIFIANQNPAEFEENIGNSIADRLQECGGIVNCKWASFRAGR